MGQATKLSEARSLMDRVGFANVKLATKLGAGDLLLIKPSRKYQKAIFKLVWKLYPRWLVRMMGDRYGQILLIEANKPTHS